MSSEQIQNNPADQTHKPTVGEKVSGTVETLVGKVTKNEQKILEGETKKTGQPAAGTQAHSRSSSRPHSRPISRPAQTVPTGAAYGSGPSDVPLTSELGPRDFIPPQHGTGTTSLDPILSDGSVAPRVGQNPLPGNLPVDTFPADGNTNAVNPLTAGGPGVGEELAKGTGSGTHVREHEGGI
ncbi:hypothetical protein P7C73_g5866, partial [Tremellales sp. Uapishka_1]